MGIVEQTETISPVGPSGALRTYSEWKRYAIEETLKQCDGNVLKACNILDVAPKTIYNVVGSERIREIRDAGNIGEQNQKREI